MGTGTVQEIQQLRALSNGFVEDDIIVFCYSDATENFIIPSKMNQNSKKSNDESINK